MLRFLEFNDKLKTKVVASVQQVVQVSTSDVDRWFGLTIDRLVSPTHCLTIVLSYTNKETRDNDLTYILDVCGLENKFKPPVILGG